jgi:hypothetical protein
MGSCGSTQSEPKRSSYGTTNQNNQQVNNVQNSNNANSSYKPNPINSQQTISKMYPRGKCVLLRKIQGKNESNDKLKSKVEVFISLLTVPNPGQYSVNFMVTEENCNPINLASLAPQGSDSNNQVIFIDSVEMNYFFERNQTLVINITSNLNGKYRASRI